MAPIIITVRDAPPRRIQRIDLKCRSGIRTLRSYGGLVFGVKTGAKSNYVV